MSLLWTRAMAWWNEGYEPEDYEHDVRDVDEPNRSRGARFQRKVMQNHGVDAPTAQRAIQHVVGHFEGDHTMTDPTEYGFASSSRAHTHYPVSIAAKLMDPKTWEGRQEQDVDLTEPIHASQDFIRPASVAHNLFHPGKKQPDYDHEAVGDPDYDPDDYRDSDDDYREDDEPEADHSKVYFMRRNSGRMEVADGHHRVATNLLLGKKSMPGIVIHERELQ
jgi:hypothetical protein